MYEVWACAYACMCAWTCMYACMCIYRRCILCGTRVCCEHACGQMGAHCAQGAEVGAFCMYASCRVCMHRLCMCSVCVCVSQFCTHRHSLCKRTFCIALVFKMGVLESECEHSLVVHCTYSLYPMCVSMHAVCEHGVCAQFLCMLCLCSQGIPPCRRAGAELGALSFSGGFSCLSPMM